MRSNGGPELSPRTGESDAEYRRFDRFLFAASRRNDHLGKFREADDAPVSGNRYGVCATWRHSARSDSIGSTDEARRAGM